MVTAGIIRRFAICFGRFDMYTEEMLVAVAKRKNNTKRKYLVVNRLQGKHIPVDPRDALEMFSALAREIKDAYCGERILIVGFAETATAIGSALAEELSSPYIQTTREKIPDAEYLFFSEQHSHATEQKLVKDDISRIIGETDRIIFAEDEVTTGNTILNIINVIEKTYGNGVRFSVASLINGMDTHSAGIYREREIPAHYLVKTLNGRYDEIADRFAVNGVEVLADTSEPKISAKKIILSGAVNPRRLTDGSEYRIACEKLAEQVRGLVPEVKSVLVLGTEECMYPAMKVGAELARAGCSVKNHATTRSPIAVSTDEGYPLQRAYSLKSLYDSERETFVYNIGRYDAVIVVTDAECEDVSAENTLVNALASAGNDNIYIIEWI